MTISDDTASLKIARQLAELWALSRGPRFRDYLSSVFGYHAREIPRFDQIYIVETQSGDVEHGTIHSLVRRWWVVDDAGLREVERESADDDQVGPFFRNPHVKFFGEDDRIVIGERLGPHISRRQVGRFNAEGSDVLTDLKTLWIHNRGAPDEPRVTPA